MRGRPRALTLPGLWAAAMGVAFVAGLAVPYLEDRMLGARVERVAEAVESVREAAQAYHAATGGWPGDGERGEAPAELAGYLSRASVFRGQGYTLDWEHWPLPDGLPERPDWRGVVGISVATPDPRLGRSLRERLGAVTADFELGDTYTFLIASM